MNTPRSLISWALLSFGPVALLHTACSSPAEQPDAASGGEGVSAITAPLSVTALPLVTGAPSLGPNPQTNVSTTCTNATPDCCVNCSLSLYGSNLGTTSPASLSAWAGSIPKLGGTNDLQQALGGAITGAQASLGAIKADNTLDFLEDLGSTIELAVSALGGTVVVQTDEPKDWVRAFPTQYGRFQTKQLKTTPCAFGQPCGTNFPDPISMEEMQFRGARSYCAMNSAASALASSGSYDMADTSLASWWKFNIGRVNPRIKLLTPTAITTPNGAEAFAIPMVLGGNLNPASGPGFARLPEMAHPLVWVTGDAAVLSQEDYGTAYKPYSCHVTNGCSSQPYSTYRKQFRNLQHVDALAGRSLSGRLDLSNVRVASIVNVINISVGGSIEIEQGIIDTTHPLASGGFLGHQFVTSYRSSLLDLGGVPGFASDAPLGFSDGTLLPMESGVPHWPWSTIPEHSLSSRTYSHDDRALVLRDSAKVQVSGTASADLSLGVADVHVGATISLDSRVKQFMIFREQPSFVEETLVKSGLPNKPVIQTNVLVTPQVENSVNINPLSIDGNFTVHLFFATISFSHNFFKAPPVSLASTPLTLVSEAHRLRVGEHSPLTTIHDSLNDSPPSYSHLPNSAVSDLQNTSVSGTQFQSFPASKPTIASCLASQPFSDASVPAPAPPGAPLAPVEMSLCYTGFNPGTVRAAGPGGVGLVTLPPLPMGICSNINGYVDGSMSTNCPTCGFSEQKECIRDALEFLCDPTETHLTQNFSGKTLVSRVRDPYDFNASDAAFGGLMKTCGEAFAHNASQAETFLSGFLGLHACTNTGQLEGI